VVSILEPTAARPEFAPGYGISAEDEGMLSWAWADECLAAGRNYWVASARPDGSPHAAPVWGVWFPEGIYFSTSRSSRKGRNLARDRRCVVHSESGDEVVILEGEVEEVALDDRIADAYEAKYDYRPKPGGEGEVWYRLRPQVAYAWLERDYVRTATRFSFD
jgi:nitroimidazol reductase NimA-like FMN-containing flavoprotein (pyridoxamine 5'-phosphate oxidase superfamily)